MEASRVVCGPLPEVVAHSSQTICLQPTMVVLELETPLGWHVRRHVSRKKLIVCSEFDAATRYRLSYPQLSSEGDAMNWENIRRLRRKFDVLCTFVSAFKPSIGNQVGMKGVRVLGHLLVVATVSLLVGCTTLNTQQKTEYALMERDHVLVKEKDPTTGAWLGILPGGGAFYGREPLVGVVDLLVWPISVLWDPVVGFETSKKVNYDLTVSELQRTKSKELSELENERDLKRIDEATYVAQKRAIEQKYDYRSNLSASPSQ